MELNEILEHTKVSYNPYMLKIFIKYHVFQRFSWLLIEIIIKAIFNIIDVFDSNYLVIWNYFDYNLIINRSHLHFGIDNLFQP